MAIASSLIHVMTGGIFHTGLSAFFIPLRDSFEVSNARLSLIFSLRSLEGGIDGPLAGYMSDRFGPRPVIFAGTILSGVGFIILGLTPSFLMFSIVFLAVMGMGFALPVHGTMVAINQWFRRRLGTAISVSTAGSAVGGFAITPLIAYIVLEYGWRPGAIAGGLMVLVVGIPASLLFRRPEPGETAIEDVPRVSRTASSGRSTQNDTSPTQRTINEHSLNITDFTVGQALRTRAYWLVAISIGLRLIMKSAVTVHFFPILVSKGVNEPTAVGLVALMSFLRLPSVFSAGLIGDRWSLSKMSAISMAFGVVAVAVMLFGPNGLLAGFLFATLIALSQGSDAITWGILGVYYGRANFGKLRGLLAISSAAFSSSGPFVVGIIVDRTGTYDLALWLLLVTSIIATLVYWIIKAPPSPERVR